MASEQDFERAFELLIGHEGDDSNTREDPGNWTGGKVGAGELKGTKYGISAASYPELDIRNLSLAEAQAIYRRDYWQAAGCPDMPPRLAFAVFDAAVNNGVGRAVRWLQGGVGAGQDGAYGPATKAALEEAVTAHRDALLEWTREYAPLQWATTQNNFGTALRTLGERKRGTARLKRRSPPSATRCWNGRASARRSNGQRR